MFGKKYPILTKSLCSSMEMLRLTIEVLTGTRANLVHIDFNTSKAAFRLGEEEHDIIFSHSRDDLMHFMFRDEWFTACLMDPGLVRVGSNKSPAIRKTVAGDFTMRWVGRSSTDRHEEPLFLENAQYCAQTRGLTLDQLLTGN